MHLTALHTGMYRMQDIDEVNDAMTGVHICARSWDKLAEKNGGKKKWKKD